MNTHWCIPCIRACIVEEGDENSFPPSKRIALTSLTPGSRASNSTSCSISANGELSPEQLSPEQLSRMEKKRTEAEARLIAKKLKATIGPSWVQALLAEFKKSYMEKVSWCMTRPLIIRSTLTS